MLALTEQADIESAVTTIEEAAPQPTGGKWLENLTVKVGPIIREWDVYQCWSWSDWPDRESVASQYTRQDIGIDVVATRRSDGGYIAIQCKSRQLDDNGQGDAIDKKEIDSFASASSDECWAERWIVTNGDNPLGPNAMASVPRSKPIKMVNIYNDLLQQQSAYVSGETDMEPEPDDEQPRQSKTSMQNEAIETCVRILKEHERSESGGLPIGQARGKIILPCGTGKTRISLRIVESLAAPGDVSVVLCPSIALVAQIRREYLQHAISGIRALAVCSDVTAGYDPNKEDKGSISDDPTRDSSNVSESEVKGQVTTDASVIADWIRESSGNGLVNVIFGTYQSSHRVAEALVSTGVTATVMVADEAHRTAGIRRIKKLDERLRDFTVCHDNERFPAKYRIYQTATPKVYGTGVATRSRNPDWVVRDMDDETVFGVELYRKSYIEAVENEWLADYRIIALGVNDPDAYRAANILASTTDENGRNTLTTTHFLKGLTLALVMGGGTNAPEGSDAVVKSCVAFMNTVRKSESMAQQLQTKTVKDWVQKWLDDNRGGGQQVSDYTMEHLDAGSNVTARDNAKSKLAKATKANPHAVLNVGIFGEGTDAPSLSSVAFLEARKSPIDVIQAVGRAMRRSEGKELGYIICPILIPPNVDAEQWLMTSGPEDGWQELGQILMALRAHDSRIEDELSTLLQFYLPQEIEEQTTVVGLASQETGRIQYHGHVGEPGDAQRAAENVLEGKIKPSEAFIPMSMVEQSSSRQESEVPAVEGTVDAEQAPVSARIPEPSAVIAGKKTQDGNIELRTDSVAREKPSSDGTLGEVDYRKTKAKAKDMINKGTGVRLPHSSKAKPKRTRQDINERTAMFQMKLSGMDDHGSAIVANLLAKSGLSQNRVMRDLNILESSVNEAARHLREDELTRHLDDHFLLDNLKEESRRKQADGATIAALLMMNAAMLHQRIAAGQWLNGVSDLATIKNDANVVTRVRREWERIMRYDFHPVLDPAVAVIQSIEDTGKLAGLERSLRHIAAEAERIAATYADMGADHAGPLFNRVMGNQASDGAFFTRPVAASIAARLTLDACGDVDWRDPQVWRDHKTIDLACGSGTLLMAILTDMKRRARGLGAGDETIAQLQKVGIEEVIKGFDMNPVSLQLAASQLTAGNADIRYREMGLHLMPYGPNADNPGQVSAGTLELIGQKAIVARDDELDLSDDLIGSKSIWSSDDASLEDAVSAAKDVRIVIMNPPFTSRSKMGEKFPQAIQQALRSRVDRLEQTLVKADPGLMGFVDKNSIMPLFVALAGHCEQRHDGVLTMIEPTIALSTPSGLRERQVLAERYHIHTVLTCHQPGNVNLSQEPSSINESIVVMRRADVEEHPPTRFINLDRLPHDDDEVDDLHQSLLSTQQGVLPNGWGEVSYWPADRMEVGDWSAAVLRSRKLAEAAYGFTISPDMLTIREYGGHCWKTSAISKKEFILADTADPGKFPIISSKGADGQLTIHSTPDAYWTPTNTDEEQRILNGGTYPQADRLLQKAGYLLLTSGQNTVTSRLTAIASDKQYVGRGWLPITGPDAEDAQAIAVFVNSTAGRLQLLLNAGKTLVYPQYNPEPLENIRIPDIKDDRIRNILADCWERTKEMVVPQFRDGECEVRRLWDEAVADAMGWNPNELTHLRHLLHNEPHVRGLGYNQYADELEKE